MDGEKLNKEGLKKVWLKFWSLLKVIVGDVDVEGKGDLQTQINDIDQKVEDCFQNASDGKKLVADAVTGKGVQTEASDTFATIAAKINKIKTSPKLQAKTAVLNTSAQTIKPDTGYDGLSQVAIPAVTGNAAAGDVLFGKTFNSAAAGITKTGTLKDNTGTADYSASASLDVTNQRVKLQVPAVAKYSTGNYLYAAYAMIASLIGLTATKLVKNNTVLGITGNSSNMDTGGATAAAGDILSGKKAGVKGSLVTGTLADKTGVADHSAEASLDATNSRLKLKVPAVAKYGTGNYLYAAYATIASLIGLTAAKLVKNNTVLGITGNSSNMDTSGATATAGDILSGKKAGVKGSLITGSIAKKESVTVDAGVTTQDETYTYLSIPANAYYNTSSKLRTKNSNLAMVKHGQMTLSNSPVTINCGFRPSTVLVFARSQDWEDYAFGAMYNGLNVGGWINNSSQGGKGSRITLTDNGFTFTAYGTIKDGYYVAVK